MSFTGRMIVSLLLLLSSITVSAQVKTEGTVRDREDKTVLPAVFVSAYIDNKSVGYAFTDSDGAFVLETAAKPEMLKLSLVGYEALTMDINGAALPLVVEMKQQKLSIASAVVTERVVEQHGDTISYNASVFKDKEDIVLKDIMMKLPGVTVTNSGGILHKGEYISKFYVEGMDLMGNQYGVVNSNLSADKIARIEIIENHQPVKALEGLELMDKSAVNIILKETARGSWLFSGDLALGAPKFPLFDSRANLGRFAKRSQEFFLVKGNNVGRDILVELMHLPYFGQTGGFLVPDGGVDADFSTVLSPRMPQMTIPKEYWFDNISGVASLNHLNKIGNDSQLRLSVQGALQKQMSKSVVQEDIVFADGTGMTIREDDSIDEKVSYLALNAGYEHNSSKKFIENRFSMSGQVRDYGSFLDSENPYTQNYSLPSFKATNSFRMNLRRSANKAFNLSNETQYIHNEHGADYSTSFADMHQDVEMSEFKNNLSSSFDLKVGRVNVDVAAGLLVDWLSMDTDTRGVEMDGVILNDDLNVLSLNPNLRFSSNFYLGKFQFRAALPVNCNFIFNADGETRVVPVVSPSVSVRRYLGQNWEFNTGLSYRMSTSGPESLLRSAVLSNYRSLSVADNLRMSRTLNGSASISFTDNVNMLLGGLSVNYFRTASDKTSSFWYSDEYTVQQWLDTPNSMSNIGLAGNLSKYYGVKTLRLTLNGSYNIVDDMRFLQGVEYDSRTRNAMASFEVNSSALRWMTIGASVSYNYAVSGPESDFISHNIISEGNITLRPVSKVSIYGDVYYGWWNSDGSVMDNVPLATCGVKWRFDKFEVFADCRNLLNADRLSRLSITTYQTISNISYLRGREFLLGLYMSF